ncbi:MAG: NAD(P)-binding protein [Candidatus Pacearchaeota archaeon]
MPRGESKLTDIQEFPRRIKIFFFVILSILFVGTFGFKILTKETIKSSLLRTLETLVFMFKENSTISERLLEVFLALVGVFLVWWVLWSFADLLLEGNLQKYLKTKTYSFIIKKMKNHIVIVGGGRFGEEIAKILSKKNKKFLIIESNENLVKSLRKKGYLTILGDASHESILKEANIETAKKLIITSPEGKTNILITLTSKELNPKLEIYSRCENPSLVSKLKKAGAKIVIVPEIIAADKIAFDLDI